MSTPDLPPTAERWVVLFDEAEALAHDGRSYGERCHVVGDAIERLNAYEHTMLPAARQMARELVWVRDTPTLPLPADRTTWGLCHCRRCASARRLEQARRQPTVYDVQRAVLRKQYRS